MMCNPRPAPAHACSPDTVQDGIVASARLQQWLAHLIALLVRFIVERSQTGRSRRVIRLLSSCNNRPDLPPGAAQQIAVAPCGQRGKASARMCLRRDIAHPNPPEICSAIIARGRSVPKVRSSRPRHRRHRPAYRRHRSACGLQWRESDRPARRNRRGRQNSGRQCPGEAAGTIRNRQHGIAGTNHRRHQPSPLQTVCVPRPVARRCLHPGSQNAGGLLRGACPATTTRAR